MADIRCPACSQIDQVQKVSSIVTAGTTRGYITNTSFSSVSQTDLSVQLAAPDKPSYKDPFSSGCKAAAILWGGGWSLIGILALVRIILHPAPIGVNDLDLVAGVLGLVILWVARSRIRGRPQARAEFATEMARYNTARNKWEELYYCYRDDGAFLPDGRSPLIPRNQIRSFCGFP